MADANIGSRERILNRVRAAVKQAAPKHVVKESGPIFPPVTDPLERFQAEAAANYMECIVTADRAGTATALQDVLASLPEGEVFVQDAQELHELLSRAGEGRALRWSNEGAPAESSQATVSLCEALVAMTGSVLVSSGCGGRGISVVAPCHIVVARLDQLVPDLESALARAREIAFDHSFLGLVSGCSRTADIEKKLVIGAHGPRRVVIIIQEQS
jgi:L-lactate dehydrogenase complex protein LldG